MSVQQLKTYVHALPWYKRIFFPQVIWECLQHESVTEADIRTIYTSQINGSWLEPFYGWLFPDLVLFTQMPFEQISRQRQVIPLEENTIQLPVNYENNLRESIADKDNSEFNRLVGFLSTHIIQEDALIRILRTSIRCDNHYATRILSQKTVYNANVVSKAFVEAVKNTNDEWWGMDAFFAFTYKSSPLRALINSTSINEIMLLLAQNYQALVSSQKEHERLKFFHIERQLQKFFKDKEICNKISLVTINQFLRYVLVPMRYESDTAVALVHDAVNFEDVEEGKLQVSDIQLAYLQTIRVGRVKMLAVFHEDTMQPADERVIQSLKDAAKNAHYGMVLNLIKKIPSARRLEILQTKAIVQNDNLYKDTQEPEFTHILQWAACRSVTEDINTILNALDKTEERYDLITSTPSHDDPSPLLLAAMNCRQENLSIMLNILSDEQAIEAILPHKVTFFTPLDQFHSHPELRHHERQVMPILLSKVFGDNQKLFAAYQYLKTHLSWDTLRALRDHYLTTYFPTNRQTTLRLFRRSYSIPGHPLNKDELDTVVRVVFYQNYHKFDSAQRSRIEYRMAEREQMSDNVAVI